MPCHIILIIINNAISHGKTDENFSYNKFKLLK